MHPAASRCVHARGAKPASMQIRTRVSVLISSVGRADSGGSSSDGGGGGGSIGQKKQKDGKDNQAACVYVCVCARLT